MGAAASCRVQSCQWEESVLEVGLGSNMGVLHVLEGLDVHHVLGKALSSCMHHGGLPAQPLPACRSPCLPAGRATGTDSGRWLLGYCWAAKMLRCIHLTDARSS